jgi:hypothetical protein
MELSIRRPIVILFLSATLLSETACSSSKPAEPAAIAPNDSSATPAADVSGPQGSGSLTVTPGEAGGVLDETFTASATITAIDAPTRQVTLKGPQGNEVQLTAGPDVRNFDQLKVGDVVTATVAQRVVVFVQTGGTPPTVVHAAAIATAPQGAKPGVIVGRAFEITATVKAIDSVNRTADLQFADGSVKTVPIRPDVDLTQYNVGDTVVIRVTQALSLIAAAQ